LGKNRSFGKMRLGHIVAAANKGGIFKIVKKMISGPRNSF